MIPFAITIDAGAAPQSSLAFMFWGAGIFVYPLMLLYAVVGYRVFRGKLEPTADRHQRSGNAHLGEIGSPHPAE
jgi:cytochrome bd ubiquinol oxidase subunit II